MLLKENLSACATARYTCAGPLLAARLLKNKADVTEKQSSAYLIELVPYRIHLYIAGSSV